MNVTKSSSLISYVGVLAMSLVLTGCGTKLDMSVINKSISDGLASQLGLTDAVVTCPLEAPPAKAGDTFECEAKPKDGGRLTLKVTQKDDKGNVAWDLVKIEGMINLKTAEEAITTGLKEQTGADVTVSCGEQGGSSLRAAKAGETFDCQAKSADGTSNTVVVTMKDNEGNISWALQQPAEEATEEPAETSEPEGK
ncbi:MAG: DUF4333 domain-containing protein [Acidobacteriota bacterium]